ncbi:hypothetical protein D3C86_1286550 [compost metagenome]
MAGSADGGRGGQAQLAVGALDRTSCVSGRLTSGDEAEAGAAEFGLEGGQGRAGADGAAVLERAADRKGVVVQGIGRRGAGVGLAADGGQDLTGLVGDDEGGFGGDDAGAVQRLDRLRRTLGQVAGDEIEGAVGQGEAGGDLAGGALGFQRQGLDPDGFGLAARAAVVADDQQGVGGDDQGDGEQQGAHPRHAPARGLVRGPTARLIAAALLALQADPLMLNSRRESRLRRGFLSRPGAAGFSP